MPIKESNSEKRLYWIATNNRDAAISFECIDNIPDGLNDNVYKVVEKVWYQRPSDPIWLQYNYYWKNFYS